MQEPYILGIDLGTGSTKAVAVDYSGNAILTAQFFYPTSHPATGYSEQNPEDIWIAFKSCLKEMIRKLAYQPTAVSFSSAMHSVIPVNSEGQPIGPMTTWADARSAAIALKLRNSDDGEMVYRTTGTPVFAMSPLSRIMWIRENDAVLFKKTARFISIKEFIWFRLFQVYEVDYSIASGTGLFDIMNLHWNKQALDLAGISEEQLSVPVSTGYTRFDFDPAIPGTADLDKGTPFVIGASDGCLANLGSLAIGKGVAAITIGTSGAVRIANGEPIYNFPAMTFNYRLDEQQFICGGPVNNGGITLQWLFRNFFGKAEIKSADYDELFNKINDIPAGSDGLVFLPYITGERAPVWDSQTSGVFFGVRLHHTQWHFARAVLEGVCFALLEVLQALEKGSGSITRVHASGGFITSRIWIQMLADITGKDIALVQAEDASAIGAAMIAMRSLSIVTDYNIFLQDKKLRIIHPSADTHLKYKQLFNVYTQLYPALKDAMHLLNSFQSTLQSLI